MRIRPTSKHAEFLVPVGTHISVSRLLSHTDIVLPLGNLLTLKSLTFRRSFSVFHCLPALSISHAEEATTKTIPRDRRQLIKLMLRKITFLPPRSHLIGRFIKRHLVTIRREQHVLAQWLRQYFVKTTAYAVYQCVRMTDFPASQHSCYPTVTMNRRNSQYHELKTSPSAKRGRQLCSSCKQATERIKVTWPTGTH